MYENVDEMLEELDRVLECLEKLNVDDTYHLALEFGYQFREELHANRDE